MNDQPRIADELEIQDTHEGGLMASRARVRPCIVGRLVDVAFGIEVLMVGPPGEPPVAEFHAADFNDPVLLFDFEPGGFRVENDLAHLKSLPDYGAANRRSMAKLAS